MNVVLEARMPVINWILERIEYKGCPQGLHVMAEELQWMEVGSISYDRLRRAADVELRRANSRIKRVTDDIYWLADRKVPLGWSLYRDQRMLPCFYRVYPPAISWEDIDKAENILPHPLRKKPF
jgi:hypothetical protein